MTKTSNIKKLVNGEIADADDVNQIVENAGTEGGLIPYDETSQNQVSDGSENIGSAPFPWGSIFLNKDADFNEINPGTNVLDSSVTISELRKFISQKDTPVSYAGAGGQIPIVKIDESGLEFGLFSNIQSFIANGVFTAPIGISIVYITMVGGGGGGAAGLFSSGSGGGGGGGGGINKFPYMVVGGNSYTVTVGAGGNGGVPNGGNGGNGGATIFDTGGGALTVNGGLRGLAGSGGTGGSSVNVSSNASGTNVGGFETVGSGAGGNGAASSIITGGGGGGSMFGAGGSNATDGEDFGAGGGGGKAGNPTADVGGGGGGGICIVEF